MKKLKILVPTDFSKTGNIAFKHAARLVETFGGTVTPLFVHYEDTQIASLFDMHLVGEHPRFRERLQERLRAAAAKYLAPSEVDGPLVLKGRAADGITKTAADFDMVVMATNARTGLDRMMQGSVAQKVIAVSSVPVLVVTDKSETGPMSRFLILTDLSKKSQKVMPHARRFIDKTGAKADLIYFQSVGPLSVGNRNQAAERAKMELRAVREEHFKGCEPEVKEQVLITSTSATEAITNLTHSREYSMVFMTTLGSSSFNNLILGSTASNLLSLVEAGLFTVNPKRVKSD